MSIFSAIGTGISVLFGSSSNGRGLVDQVSDVADKWMPSAETKQKNSIEDLKAGDASQDSARAMILASHDSWFDILIDGLNRSVRPFITFWVMGVLFGWWVAPATDNIDPIVLNIMWTVITFWFGSRVVFKDVPNAITAFKAVTAKNEQKKADEKKKASKRKELEESMPFEDD